MSTLFYSIEQQNPERKKKDKTRGRKEKKKGEEDRSVQTYAAGS